MCSWMLGCSEETTLIRSIDGNEFIVMVVGGRDEGNGEL